MKRKTDIEIGKRFTEELYRIFPGASNRKIAKILKCSPTNIQYWADGKTPSGIYLARIIYYGGDVNYILTGRRKYPDTEPDFLAEYEEEYI